MELGSMVSQGSALTVITYNTDVIAERAFFKSRRKGNCAIS